MGLIRHLKNIKGKRFTLLGVCFALIITPLLISSNFTKQIMVGVKAADYSGGGSGFTLNSDGSIQATFSVSNNTLDMRGWVLCLFTNKPSIDSNNKLTNSNDTHPYSYSSCAHYFFASNTAKTGNITVTWAANSADQKTHWNASGGTHSTDNLNTIYHSSNSWYIVIGPRHYNTSWGDSGIGAGTNGYWENCDYYVGSSGEVFPTDEKDMTVNVTSYSGNYDGNSHSIIVNVADPASGYTIKYRTTSSGSYDLTTNPTYTNVGTYTTYFQISKSGYNTYQGSATVKITVNDKSALNQAINSANTYLSEIQSEYPTIAYYLNEAIVASQAVSQNDNKTAVEIATSREELIYSTNLAHARVTDRLIQDIGEVRLTEKCENDIEEAETSYNALTSQQKELVNYLSDLWEARALFDKLEIVADKINNIGEVTYDDECLTRINEAREAYEELSEEEQILIPTLFNDLKCAEDIYNAIKAISNLGNVEYSQEYLEKLQKVRKTYNALDPIEQESISNYQDLLDAENTYHNVDTFVQLVNQIPETLEYVGTHNEYIDEADKAYKALNNKEKDLAPALSIDYLSTAIEEYEELKIEHERKEIEDREAGVVIATEGGSGIPDTVSININNSNDTEQDFTDDINYQTIEQNIASDEAISSICEIKFYEEVEGEVIELSLKDIDENMSLVVKIDVPLDVNESNFKIVLLDDDNNFIEVEYTYDLESRQASIVTNKVGAFAIISIVGEPAPATRGLPWAIILTILVSLGIATIGYFSIKKKKNG